MEHKYNVDSGEEVAQRVTIGPATPVQIAMVIGFLTVCGGGFGSSIWWASSISAKMDVLITRQTAMEAGQTALTLRVADLEQWKVKMETGGTPAMQRQTEALRQEMDHLVRDFELHKATTTPNKP